MLIETLPMVLTWEGTEETLEKVHGEYVMDAMAGLARTWARLYRDDRSELARSLASMAELDEDSRLRFITAPEVTCRIYWQSLHSEEERCHFFANALDAEKRRHEYLRSNGRGQLSRQKELWTAIGDYCFCADGSVFAAPRLCRSLAADFVSPYARTTDTGVPSSAPATARAPMSTQSQLIALGKLKLAADGIAQSSLRIWSFVTQFTKALVIQPDPELDGFASGSSGQFVGRSALWNLQSKSVDEVDVAEGLVHEAIHSLLYMQERLTPWVHKQELYGSEIRTRSQWTGTPLPLRPFLQACFVWYGLANFWLAALRGNVFVRERIIERLSQALCGFSKGELVNHVKEWAPHIDPALLSTIDELQERVVFALRSLTLEAHG